ncbi:MAG TPA: hypothetical protein VLW45_07985 [Pelomicrobium sp.]|nr:hypothetical protein [Pelomicrobium sp.]
MKREFRLRVTWLAGWVAALLALAPLCAFAAHENLPAEAKRYLGDQRYDVMVVSILQIDNARATNEFPPDGVMRVEETLRGELRANAAYNFRLQPPRHALDYELEDGRLTKLRAEWYRRPFAGPKEGAGLIVFAQVADNPLGREQVVVLEGPWLAATAETRTAALVAMLPPERSVLLQRALLALILLAPIAGIALLIREWHQRGRGFTPRHAAAGGLQVAAFLLYAVYESGITDHASARGDLSLLLPALVLSAVLLILLAPRLAEGRRDGVFPE